MADSISPERRSAIMAAIKGRDTKPEIAVRRVLRSLGIGYRLHGKELPGRPDIVMKGRRTVIFVHGCFWHRHGGCRQASTPKSRQDYWQPKFAANVARDARNQQMLLDSGWTVLVVWECETEDAKRLAERINGLLSRGNYAPNGRTEVRNDACATEDRAPAQRKVVAGP
jgi:DNA mismatch endonuclease Vsr